jgi:RNA polymerase sigma-70 factor (ECF subfamily)
MAQSLAGDRETYAHLLAELSTAIEAYLRSRFGEWEALEDCVQESLLAIHRARHTYDPKRPFRPWLFTIVRHKAIDLLRRRLVREAGLSLAAGPAQRPPDPEPRLDGAKMLDWLEPKYREALVLTKLEGFSVEEAAARAGVSVTAMKTRVHRAIRTIQKRLRAEESA